MQDWWKATFPQGRQTLTIIDANGHPVSIAYGEKGTGKPIFLIHGIGSWCYSWRNCIDLLSQHFKVICFDAKNHGFSDKLEFLEQPGHQVVELKRIIQALCDEPAIIVAESMGALVSLALIQAHPELFYRLVVINVPIFPEQLPSRWMRLLSYLPLQLIKAIDYLRLAYWFAPLVRALVGLERREVLALEAKTTPEEAYGITYPYIYLPKTIVKLTQELQLAAQEISCFQNSQPNLISNIQDQLANINCPTLILWSDQDSWFPATDGMKLQNCIPNSQLQILSNCGHSASASCSDAITAAIVAFVQDTSIIP